MDLSRWRGRTACAVHAYSLVGSDSCIGGGATLTARFPLQAVRAGVGASKGTPPVPRGTLGTSSCARRTRPPVVQGAAVDTRPLCAAACDLRGECVAFSHTAARAGGICTLHGALHEGLVPQFNMLGEFTLDLHHHVTDQARHSHICEYFEYPSTSHSLTQARAASGLCRGRSRRFACRPSARTATPFACASSCADSRALQQPRRWLV